MYKNKLKTSHPKHLFNLLGAGQLTRSTDLFQLNGKDYLLLAASYSKWIEIEFMKHSKCYYTIDVPL